MDVVLIFNGLGNQMSQYAFYLAKKKIDKNCKVIFDPNSHNEHNGSELDKIFNISYNKNLLNRILSKIYSFRRRPKIWRILTMIGIREIKESNNYDFNPKFLKKGKIGINFYWGGWHSEKYYQDIVNEVKETYKFPRPTESSFTHYFSLIKRYNSVSMHIRRGDYLKYSEYGNVATLNFYKQAINYINDNVDNPYFFVFSNDLDWCKKQFQQKNFIFIDCNSKENSWRDMYMISACKHHINANSTFSWWGAWLSKEKGITIVPKQFLQNIVTKDIYPKEWIKI